MDVSPMLHSDTFWHWGLPFSYCYVLKWTCNKFILIAYFQNIRPTIPERWICNETLFSVSNIMQESWSQKPSSRLSHLRVKKAFAKLIDNSVDIKSGWKKRWLSATILAISAKAVSTWRSGSELLLFSLLKKYYLRFLSITNYFYTTFVLCSNFVCNS